MESAVVQLFMSENISRAYQEMMANPMWGWVGIIAAWQIFPNVFSPVYAFALRAWGFL